jgi:peptidoglycan hydrolase-like protein with peptidoglycan-binding domain
MTIASPVAVKVAKVAAVGVGGFVLYKLFAGHGGFGHRHVQSMRMRGPGGKDATVAVPAIPDAPELGLSDAPATSPVVGDYVDEEDLGFGDALVPDGYGSWARQEWRRRFRRPPVTPGLFPLAPAVVTPYGAAPLSIRDAWDAQRALNALGYGPLKVDGHAGPVTHAAVVEFQQKNGIPPVGYTQATPSHLQNALANAIPRSTTPAPSPSGGRSSHHGECAIGDDPIVVSAASTTPAVVAQATGTAPITTTSAVQVALNKAGATPALKVDGTLGPKTVAATKAFQITCGLVADGVPGPKTRTALAVATTPEPQKTAIPCPPPSYGYPGASASFANAHLPFGAEGATASFKHAHLPFGFGGDSTESWSGASANYKNAAVPFGAEVAGGVGGASASFAHAHLPFGCDDYSDFESPFKGVQQTFGGEMNGTVFDEPSFGYPQAHPYTGVHTSFGEGSFDGSNPTFGAAPPPPPISSTAWPPSPSYYQTHRYQLHRQAMAARPRKQAGIVRNFG